MTWMDELYSHSTEIIQNTELGLHYKIDVCMGCLRMHVYSYINFTHAHATSFISIVLLNIMQKACRGKIGEIWLICKEYMCIKFASLSHKKHLINYQAQINQISALLPENHMYKNNTANKYITLLTFITSHASLQKILTIIVRQINTRTQAQTHTHVCTHKYKHTKQHMAINSRIFLCTQHARARAQARTRMRSYEYKFCVRVFVNIHV